MESGESESKYILCSSTQENLLLQCVCPDLGIPQVKHISDFQKGEIIGEGNLILFFLLFYSFFSLSLPFLSFFFCLSFFLIFTGGFGVVRKGVLSTGDEVAVKTLNCFLQKLDSPVDFFEEYKLFYHEVTVLKRTYTHPNLLRQIGISANSGEIILELVKEGIN